MKNICRINNRPYKKKNQIIKKKEKSPSEKTYTCHDSWADENDVPYFAEMDNKPDYSYLEKEINYENEQLKLISRLETLLISKEDEKKKNFKRDQFHQNRFFNKMLMNNGKKRYNKIGSDSSISKESSLYEERIEFEYVTDKDSDIDSNYFDIGMIPLKNRNNNFNRFKTNSRANKPFNNNFCPVVLHDTSDDDDNDSLYKEVKLNTGFTVGDLKKPMISQDLEEKEDKDKIDSFNNAFNNDETDVINSLKHDNIEKIDNNSVNNYSRNSYFKDKDNDEQNNNDKEENSNSLVDKWGMNKLSIYQEKRIKFDEEYKKKSLLNRSMYNKMYYKYDLLRKFQLKELKETTDQYPPDIIDTIDLTITEEQREMKLKEEEERKQREIRELKEIQETCKRLEKDVSGKEWEEEYQREKLESEKKLHSKTKEELIEEKLKDLNERDYCIERLKIFGITYSDEKLNILNFMRVPKKWNKTGVAIMYNRYRMLGNNNNNKQNNINDNKDINNTSNKIKNDNNNLDLLEDDDKKNIMKNEDNANTINKANISNNIDRANTQSTLHLSNHISNQIKSEITNIETSKQIKNELILPDTKEDNKIKIETIDLLNEQCNSDNYDYGSYNHCNSDINSNYREEIDIKSIESPNNINSTDTKPSKQVIQINLLDESDDMSFNSNTSLTKIKRKLAMLKCPKGKKIKEVKTRIKVKGFINKEKQLNKMICPKCLARGHNGTKDFPCNYKRCFYCNKSDHLSNNCIFNTNHPKFNDRHEFSVTCKKCKAVGHESEDCLVIKGDRDINLTLINQRFEDFIKSSENKNQYNDFNRKGSYNRDRRDNYNDYKSKYSYLSNEINAAKDNLDNRERNKNNNNIKEIDENDNDRKKRDFIDTYNIDNNNDDNKACNNDQKNVYRKMNDNITKIKQDLNEYVLLKNKLGCMIQLMSSVDITKVNFLTEKGYNELRNVNKNAVDDRKYFEVRTFKEDIEETKEKYNDDWTPIKIDDDKNKENVQKVNEYLSVDFKMRKCICCAGNTEYSRANECIQCSNGLLRRKRMQRNLHFYE